MSDTLQTCVICPQRRRTDNGAYVCFGCGNKILRWLRDLEDYIPTLSVEKPTKPDASGTNTGFGPRSPAHDVVIHHTDWRSGWDALDGLGAVATLHSWACAVREDRAITPPDHATLVSEIGALRANHAWITHQPFVDEYAGELREVHAAVRSAASDPVPRSVGRCIAVHSHGECQGQVYEMDDASGVRCSVCRRQYNGLDLARFRAAQETG